MYICERFITKKYRQNIRIVFITILIFSFFIACDSNEKEYVDMPFDKETTPTMYTDSVTMLISDSGVVRYKIITTDWKIFESASDPYSYFPEGIYLEKFDTSFHKEVTLKADTAWNYTRQKIWKLKGHVFIKNIKDETFSSEEVIWDERQQKVHSDKYIEINRPNKLMLKGFGFESNQSMTEYRVFKPHDTEIIVEEKEDSNQ